jgi:putative ABC transport system substrate-binding protein
VASRPALNGRRVFLTALAVVFPFSALAQVREAPLIAFIHSGSPEPSAGAKAAFLEGLRSQGYVEGQNLRIEYRWADDQYDRLPPFFAEMVRLRVSLIAATGGPVSAIAARSATSTIPIVFTAVADPVRSGLVESLRRPGANITGTAGLTTELDPKRLDFLRELLPDLRRVGALINPNRPNIDAQVRELLEVGRGSGIEIVVLRAGSGEALKVVAAQAKAQQVGALLVTADPFFVSQRDAVIKLADEVALPAIYQWREFTQAGGLMSCGASRAEAYLEAGVYAGRILRGERPENLPVLQPARFELVVNLRAAKALGIEFPPTILTQADDVID